MKIFETHRVEAQILVSHVCNRCGRDLTADTEKHESLEIAFVAGYDSVFGDGNKVEGDFCQHCIQELLGQWLCIRTEIS